MNLKVTYHIVINFIVMFVKIFMVFMTLEIL